MKIITADGVYVQLNDIAYLYSLDLPIIPSVYTKPFKNGMIINEINRYKFIKFEEKIEIDYFKNLDWIVDYGRLQYLQEQEIYNLTISIAEKLKTMDLTKNNIEIKLLKFKFRSLVYVLWYKQGYIKLELPKDVQDGKIIKPKRID